MDPLGVCIYAHKRILGVPCSLSLLHTQSSRLSITLSQCLTQRHTDSSHSYRDAHYLARLLDSATVLKATRNAKGLDIPPLLSLMVSQSIARHRQ